jgi:serine/threonine protein kinase/tetratricopeptide (TPR) repeat protein
MSGFELGSFEVREKIASGGMGDVWRGVHVAQDVPAAIKVIRRRGAEDAQFRTLFRREVRAVAQLDHPGIITLFDIGEVSEDASSTSAGAIETGSPYLVMEYLERGSLEALEYPLSWQTTREILLAVLDGLAHAHARGITHRDLKPGNILLAEGTAGSPIRLTDFGIAFSYRESRSKEAEGTAVGTPAYMAPEQFMGEWRDFGPWTDLYALGCVAYQLTTGRVPFDQGDLVQLGLAHLQNQPPDLDCPSDYPDGFEGWVLKLLEKEPENRYRRCADAAVELVSLTPQAPTRDKAITTGVETERLQATTVVPFPGRSTGTQLDWRAHSPPRRPFKLIGAGLRLFGLRTVPMVDRDSERDLLWSMFRRVHERGMPGLVVLEGSAGSGKSRLAEWLCERTHEMGLAESLRTEHDRSRGRESGLSHMLAAAWSCLGLSADQLQNRVTTILSSAGIESRALHQAATEFLAPASLGEDYSPGMFHEFRSMAARFSCLLEVLRRVYRETPLVVCLEDVHWGADALHFARYVLERSPTERIRMMVLLTARDDLVVESPKASGLLRELCTGEAAECTRLEPLSDEDSRRLVSSLMYLEGDLAERVSVRSGGNPLYATQLVGDWVERGILRAGVNGFVLTEPVPPEVPDDIHAVWVQRLERVLDESVGGVALSPTPAAQRIDMQVALELAAALDGTVDMAEWMSLCLLARTPDPSPVLESLLALRLARAGVDGWSFSHSMLRDSIERIAKEKRRWASHNRLCANMLAERHPVPRWGDSERIGRHRFEATQFEAAVGPLLRGAKERMRVEDYSAALGLLTLHGEALNQLNSPIDDPQRLEAWLLRADINCTRRDLSTAEELANRVRGLADSPDTQRFDGAALLVLARVHQHQAMLQSALDYYSEAQRILRITGPKHELATCLSEQANAMLEMDQLEQAWDAFGEAQEIFEETGQFVPWAENQLGLARVALRQGNLDHALTLCRRVQAFARREELNRIEATAWSVLSEVQRAQDQSDDAELSLDKSIELFEQLGVARQALHPKLMKIILIMESGSVDQARLEFELLRSNPTVDIPRITALLMCAVGLAIGIDGADRDFGSSFDQTAALLQEAEVLTPDVVHCLLLAIARGNETGFPDRAAQVKQLGGSVAAQLGNADIVTRFS